MEVELTQGKVVQIDPEDRPLVSQHKWYAVRKGCGKWSSRLIFFNASPRLVTQPAP